MTTASRKFIKQLLWKLFPQQGILDKFPVDSKQIAHGESDSFLGLARGYGFAEATVAFSCFVLAGPFLALAIALLLGSVFTTLTLAELFTTFFDAGFSFQLAGFGCHFITMDFALCRADEDDEDDEDDHPCAFIFFITFVFVHFFIPVVAFALAFAACVCLEGAFITFTSFDGTRLRAWAFMLGIFELVIVM